MVNITNMGKECLLSYICVIKAKPDMSKNDFSFLMLICTVSGKKYDSKTRYRYKVPEKCSLIK